MITSVQIRPLEKEDLPRVLEIEKASFLPPWTAKDFAWAFYARGMSNVLLRVTETKFGFFRTRAKQSTVGYLVYRTERSILDVWNMAIDPRFRRQGYGTILIDYLKGRLIRGVRRKKIRVLISELNLPGQLFLRSCGFRCEEIVHRCWNTAETGDVDAYSMEFYKPHIPRNRLQFGGLTDVANI